MWYLISAADLEQYLDQGRQMFLVDLRDQNAYEESHIRGAVNIPVEELPRRLEELPKDRLIVLYCYHGPHSMMVAKQLSRLGYWAADVYGGIRAYRGKYLVSSDWC